MLDVAAVRACFPALRREAAGRQACYFDGPGGSQVPATVIEAMGSVLRGGVSNLTDRFPPGRLAVEITDRARSAMADFLNAEADGIVFGQNMTSLTFAMSRSLAGTWSAGDHIVVTALDHDANRTPWVLAARDAGASVTVVPFESETGRLDPGTVTAALRPNTRLVAVAYASNALGTVVDVAEVAASAHAMGALVYVDAVHFAPHRSIDVSALGCDFIAVSAYKFFGPHTGVVYGRPDLLERLDAYKVRPSPTHGPAKWESGTQSFESLAGVTAAVDYLASLGEGPDRRSRLVSAYDAIWDHERTLGERFLDGIGALPSVRLFGPASMEDRVPTFAIDVGGHRPEGVAQHLAERGMFVWDGHYYAVGVMEQLGLLDQGGLVRIGFLHYTSHDEVDALLEAIAEVSTVSS